MHHDKTIVSLHYGSYESYDKLQRFINNSNFAIAGETDAGAILVSEGRGLHRPGARKQVHPALCLHLLQGAHRCVWGNVLRHAISLLKRALFKKAATIIQ